MNNSPVGIDLAGDVIDACILNRKEVSYNKEMTRSSNISDQ